jgi:hypothetical protein
MFERAGTAAAMKAPYRGGASGLFSRLAVVELAVAMVWQRKKRAESNIALSESSD